MRGTRVCGKCGAVAEGELSDDSAACPKCGAIYAKVESTRSARPEPPAQVATRATPTPPATAHTEFLGDLRAASHYPTFRGVVNVTYWFWIALAVLTFVGAAGSLMLPFGGTASVIVGLLSGLLFILIGRFMKECALMLADLSDAAILIAQK
jgi:hypothetical protein